MLPNYVAVRPQEIEHHRGRVVLLVTATRVELETVQRALHPFPNGDRLKVFIGAETYFLGLFANQPVAVVRCEMGSSGRDSAIAVCTAAIQAWRPRAAIMVGIAFGKDPGQQRMCDVLVANSLIPYELGKIGRKHVYRAPHPPANGLLINRLANATHWNFRVDGARVQVRVGPVLSGEKVLDNRTAKARLFRQFPHAVGGEMEGVGLFVASDRAGTPWAVVKAICDWGDGTKRDSFQTRAARASVDFVRHVLAEPGCLDALPAPTVAGPFDPDARHALNLQSGTDSVYTPTLIAPVADMMTSQPAGAPTERTRRLPRTATELPRLSLVPGRLRAADTKRTPRAGRAVRTGPARPAILTRPELVALRIIATAPTQLAEPVFRALFPAVDWDSALGALRRKGAIRGNGVNIAASIRSDLFEGKLRATFETRWLRRLEALRQFSDTAILLSLHYLRARRYDDAVEALTDIAQSMDPGSDSKYYRSLLENFIRPEALKVLSSERTVHLFNAYALCLAREGRPADALPYFAKLLRLSRSSGSAYGVGQAYINQGVVYFELGDMARAATSYDLALLHARAVKDTWLEARALNNLAAIRAQSAPEVAAAYLDRSLQLKRANGDVAGIAASLGLQGNLAAYARNYDTAVKCYSQALSHCRRADLRYELALTLNNIGSVHVDRGRPREALSYYREASELSSREGFADVALLCLQGRAVAYTHMSRHRRATKAFTALARAHNQQGNSLAFIQASHDGGVVAARSGDFELSQRLLGNALRAARAEAHELWIFRCIFAIATLNPTNDSQRAEARLVSAARSARRQRLNWTASQLWLAILDRRIAQPSVKAMVREAASAAVGASTAAGKRRAKLAVFKRLCIWHRDREEPREALRYAEQVSLLAMARDERLDKVLAIDEQACCYERLGDLRRAEGLHRRALADAEAMDSTAALQAPLVNLTTLLRTTGRLDDALAAARRGVNIAKRHRDLSLEAVMVQQRGWILLEKRKYREARSILIESLERIRAANDSRQESETLRCLACVAYADGDPRAADGCFQMALAVAARQDQEPTSLAEDYVAFLCDRMTDAFSRKAVAEGRQHLRRAQRIADKFKLTAARRRLLLAFGEANWQLGPRYFAAGVQGYLAAAALVGDAAPEEALRLFAQAGTELILQFFRLPNEIPLPRIAILVKQSTNWLRSQVGTRAFQRERHLLCWPLSAGLLVATKMRTPNPPTPETIAGLVGQTFREAWKRRAQVRST